MKKLILSLGLFFGVALAHTLPTVEPTGVDTGSGYQLSWTLPDDVDAIDILKNGVTVNRVYGGPSNSWTDTTYTAGDVYTTRPLQARSHIHVGPESTLDPSITGPQLLSDADSVFTTNPQMTVSGTDITVQADFDVNTTMRIGWYPQADGESAIQYRNCEWSDRYGDTLDEETGNRVPGNAHSQTLSTSLESTAVVVRVYTSSDVGTSVADCPNLTWYQVHEEVITTGTAGVGLNVVSLDQLQPFPGADVSRFTNQWGNWVGVLGGTAPPSGNQNWMRYTIPANGQRAGNHFYPLPGDPTEAWVSYDMQVGTNMTNTSSVKIPGVSSVYTRGYGNQSFHVPSVVSGGNTILFPDGKGEDPGGNGGNAGGLGRSWSARLFLRTPANNHEITSYLYHADIHTASANTNNGVGLSDHPSLNSANDPIQSNKRLFGLSNTPSSDTGAFNDNSWHTLTIHFKFNTPDDTNYNNHATANRDGFVRIYLDGVQIMEALNINWSQVSAYGPVAFWMIVFHGGNEDTSGTESDLFLDNFRWNAGSTAAAGHHPLL